MEPLVVLAAAAPAAGAAGWGSYLLTVRAARRCRRAADLARLRAESLTPGPRGDVARARRRLAAEVEATADLLRHCDAASRPVGDTASLLARLRVAAASLDAELALLGRERDPHVRRQGSQGALAQADELVRAAGALRLALARRRERRDVDALVEDLRLEARALRA
ncbi:hypothetical protein [Motilibacter deserti]|uniref:Uncharacterized protein n=1 Tax=Motilibacter deserti TaxID=2714956 RepID=A0ABX0GUE2_9ACTN|nr:hypothetical protein [Motilibacter deserti]NHC14524.1 hypothetical protein [Motilibacter deserti]